MLYEKLKKHNKIPFHMPGHKRNTELLGKNFPYSQDITEITDFDNLHNPQGIIKDIENKIKKLYYSDNSFLLVNGTTCGILAGIYTAVNEGDKVLVARNCHKSVYNALKLAKAEAVYIQPEFDEYGISGRVLVNDVREAIESQDIKLIVVTSPTYEGIISDVKSICEIAHSKNIPVMVDSAHGAHYFEKSNADIIIMSLHKTLPALTQCAVAHINGNMIDADEFRINLSIFETSSPSYILMSSIEECVDFAVNNPCLFEEHRRNLDYFYSKLSTLKNLKLLRNDDASKIVVFTGYSSMSSRELADVLRNQYNIEIEMVSRDYLLAMSTVCDSQENLELFLNALLEIDSKILSAEYKKLPTINMPKKYCVSHNIKNKGSFFPLNDCCGKISCEYIWAYPPGIPVLVPGEVISEDILTYIKSYKNNGVEVYSTYNKLPLGIYCDE